MCAHFTNVDELTNFWGNFEGEKTLHNAIYHYACDHNMTNSESKTDFAMHIIPKIIGQNFEARKLLELLDLELSDIDLSTIPVQNTSKNKESFEKISVFDADKLDGFAFESFIAKIMEFNKFTDVSITRGSGDQGGDILAKRGDEKLVLQTKRFSIDKKVTNSAVQEVLGAIAWYNVHKGIVVTNSIFTNSAKELAQKNNIELWDRKIVSKFIEVYNSQQNSEGIKEFKSSITFVSIDENE